jgi:DNA-binding GntR family transcriptional regulator
MPAASLVPTRLGAAERVRVLLEEEILGGVIAPGSRVKADEVAQRMGTSHIPVREALRALEADGWVVHRAHEGMSVRPRVLSELVDLFEARALVEPRAVELAAQRRTSDDLGELERVIRLQERSTDPADLARLNYDFHVALAAAAHNSTLGAVVESMSKRVRFHYLPAASARRPDSLADHRELLALVERREGERAADLARRHIEATRVNACAALEALIREEADAAAAEAAG